MMRHGGGTGTLTDGGIDRSAWEHLLGSGDACCDLLCGSGTARSSRFLMDIENTTPGSGLISRLVRISPDKPHPSPENEELYSDRDESLREFADHIRRDGYSNRSSSHEITALSPDTADMQPLCALVLRVCRVESSASNDQDFRRTGTSNCCGEFDRQRSKTIDGFCARASSTRTPKPHTSRW